ncbi:hypothetical protein PPACK8108_LOCUS11014 [Phakopsora pachyrhizi]|uniref:Uncharacterized protein n=1 Tax=Phakopsora pachyrhizi TaxID=170000 RepID=A0AAV0B1B3_PHAPC|nr:hypothetical protein PPACK8108_LOCUS11014 [Phakopsora pachyrhizi]
MSYFTKVKRLYGNLYYGGYYHQYDNQSPYYGYGQPDYVTGHAEGSGSILMKSTHQEAPLKAYTCKS